MAEMFEKLSEFFYRVKVASFWERVLPWKWASLRSLSYDAYSQYERLVDLLERNRRYVEEGRTSVATLRQENEQLKVNNASRR